MNTIKYSSAVSVDKGLIRNNNEDNFYLDGEHLTENNRDNSDTFTHNPSEEVQIYGVFDGMGGEAMGEVASLIAAQAIKKTHQKIKEKEVNLEKIILNTVQSANAQICKKMMDSGERRIGATFSLLAIDDDKATVFNVGDSRVYMVRDGELKQISVDDTSVQRLINMGMITDEEAKTHKDRHKLTQHLGIFSDEMKIEPHISEPITIKKDDLFLLCSDGLTDMLKDEEILEILKQKKNCKEFSSALVKAALKNGGEDNVTALVVRADSEKQSVAALSVKKYIVPAAIAAVCIVAAAVLLIGGNKDNKPKPQQKQQTLENTLSVKEEPVEARKIYFINPVELVAVGTENTFMIGIEPAKARSEISFKTSDEAVITIDEKTGSYKAISPGTAVITATKGKLNCEITIKVYEPIENVEGIPAKVTLNEGETKKITYTVTPQESDTGAIFSSEDENIATVSADGTITAKSVGGTKITVSINDYSKTIELEVKKIEKPENKETNNKSSDTNKEEEQKKQEPEQPAEENETSPKNNDTPPENNGDGMVLEDSLIS